MKRSDEDFSLNKIMHRSIAHCVMTFFFSSHVAVHGGIYHVLSEDIVMRTLSMSMIG